MPESVEVAQGAQVRAASKGRFYPWIIISLSAAFLFYKYVLQVSPGIMSSNLMQAFSINGAQLGNLAAVYFYGYLIVQLFAGPLLDKFGARRVTPLAILSCALGAFFFSQSQTLADAIFARILMGMGVGFATVNYLKMASDYFHPRQFAFIGGLLATAVMLGAVFGETPLVIILEKMGWRNMLLGVSFLGVGIAILFFFIAREKKSDHHYPKEAWTKQGLLKILKNPQNWLLTIYSGFAFSPIAVLGGLWGNPFLRAAYPMSLEEASFLLSWIFIGFGVGGPVLGFLSDKIRNRRLIMQLSAMVSFISLTTLLYCPGLSALMIGFLMFMVGFCTGAFMLAFALAKEINMSLMMATVVAMINTGSDIFGALTEPVVGKFLDMHWQGQLVDGARLFSVENYHYAFIILPIYLILAWGILFFIPHEIK
jgi:MFS family permease